MQSFRDLTPGGTSLLVQCLRLCTPNAGGPSSIPGQGAGCPMLKLRALLPQLQRSAAKEIKKKENLISDNKDRSSENDILFIKNLIEKVSQKPGLFSFS